MLRNSYIENYKPKSYKTRFFEREIALFHTDLNRVIYSQRPMSTRSIKKLPKKIFPLFIDDIMCNHKINSLLYSSNAFKESNFYLKQKNSLLNSNQINTPSKKKTKLSPLGQIMLNRSNIQKIKALKEKINAFLEKRNKIFENYKIKQESFEKIQPNMEIKLKKLYYKPINEIKLKGFKRAFNQCLKKSKTDDNFELPNIQFNMNDAFSRLSYNVILSQKILKEKEKNEKSKNEINESYNSLKQKQINNFNQIKNQKFQTIITSSTRNKYFKKISIKKKQDKSYNSESEIPTNDYNYYYRIKNMPKLNISNILKFNSGKEFKIKITPRIKKRCLSALSCGPKPRKTKSRQSSERKEEEKKEEINYEDIRNKSIFNISKSKSKENINNLILYNTLMVDKNNRGCDVVKVKNYRDENLNTNLHIAVMNNSIKLIKYFIDEKLDPNAINNKGKTPLHLAMKEGNKEVIKFLINSGANTTIKDNRGRIPIDYASKKIKHYFIFENPK